MKNYLTYLLLTLLVACNGPLKLYEKGNHAEAYIKLLEKNSLNESEKTLLIELHAERIAQDQLLIEQWMNADSLELWPRISGRLQRIENIQETVNVVAQKQEIPIAQFASFSNLDSKLELANEKAAEYYYQRQQQEFQFARNGNKKAARRGFEMGERIIKYNDNYKDAGKTNRILKDLGTDYIVMIYDSSYLQSREIISLDAMTASWNFPENQFWSKLSLNPQEFNRVDYWLDVAPYRAGIGPPIYEEDRCSNSEEVQVGCKTVKEWNATDSVFIEKQVPIFETVRVEVVNVEQIITADLPFQLTLFKAGQKDEVASTEKSVRYRWTNEFGDIVFGDPRAVRPLCCPDSGSEMPFPSDELILANLGSNMKRPIRSFLETHLDTFEK